MDVGFPTFIHAYCRRPAFRFGQTDSAPRRPGSINVSEVGHAIAKSTPQLALLIGRADALKCAKARRSIDHVQRAECRPQADAEEQAAHTAHERGHQVTGQATQVPLEQADEQHVPAQHARATREAEERN
jgi:hypothetical protein